MTVAEQALRDAVSDAGAALNPMADKARQLMHVLARHHHQEVTRITSILSDALVAADIRPSPGAVALACQMIALSGLQTLAGMSETDSVQMLVAMLTVKPL